MNDLQSWAQRWLMCWVFIWKSPKSSCRLLIVNWIRPAEPSYRLNSEIAKIKMKISCGWLWQKRSNKSQKCRPTRTQVSDNWKQVRKQMRKVAINRQAVVKEYSEVKNRRVRSREHWDTGVRSRQSGWWEAGVQRRVAAVCPRKPWVKRKLGPDNHK